MAYNQISQIINLNSQSLRNWLSSKLQIGRANASNISNRTFKGKLQNSILYTVALARCLKKLTKTALAVNLFLKNGTKTKKKLMAKALFVILSRSRQVKALRKIRCVCACLNWKMKTHT